MKAADRRNWIAIRTKAVPLKTCTAMATEVAVAGVLTVVLNRFFDKQVNMQTVTDRIKRIVDDTMNEKQ